MGVHHAKAADIPYYLTRYFHWQVVTWIIKHHLFVYRNKYLALMANYGLAEETPQFMGPLSFKDYLHHLLCHDFWGDEIVLYVISCMWQLRITVVNSHTLEEYQIHHSFPFKDADVGLVYNVGSHYSAAGVYCTYWSRWWLCCFIQVILLVALLVTCYWSLCWLCCCIC